MLIAVGILAPFFGQAQSTQVLISQITALAGPAVAGLFKQLSSSTSPFSSLWVAVTTVGFSLGGAIGAFAVWRDTMDVIWEVKSPKKESFAKMVKQRIGPFVIVSFLGLIVIAWTGIDTFLYGAIKFFSINGTFTFITITIARILLLFGLVTLIFAITYKLIPDAKVHWRDSLVGAAVAGVAFIATNFIIGTYVATFTVTTIIGSAGSLMIILLWIFILNQIMLFGAEVTKVYAITSPTHSKEHLSLAAEKIVKTFELAEEKIEEATKGDGADLVKKTEEKSMDEDGIEKKEDKNKEKTVETENSTIKQTAESAEPETSYEGSVEVKVKIKTNKKASKSQE